MGVHMRPMFYLHLVRSSLSVVGGKLSKLAGVARAGAAGAERAECTTLLGCPRTQARIQPWHTAMQDGMKFEYRTHTHPIPRFSVIG